MNLNMEWDILKEWDGLMKVEEGRAILTEGEGVNRDTILREKIMQQGMPMEQDIQEDIIKEQGQEQESVKDMG